MTLIMSESLERKLGWRERAKLRLHLLVCLYCLRYLEQLLFIHKILRRPDTSTIVDSSTPALSPEASERIKRKLKDTPRVSK